MRKIIRFNDRLRSAHSIRSTSEKYIRKKGRKHLH